MSDFLPEGIIFNILIRLPIKTLIRCMCVSRSWYTLITSPEFISSHLNFAIASKEGHPLLLIRRCDKRIESYDLYFDNASFDPQFTLEFPFRSINEFFTIIGSCNGLLCLSDDRVFHMNTIIIWNPCVKKSVLLPKPNLIHNSYGSFMQSLGFGFDSISNDCKVVRITYTDFDGRFPQIELYKSSIGVWQDISHLALKYIIRNRSHQVYINGATHWIASSVENNDLILSFDMHNEVFHEIVLPARLAKDDPQESKELMIYKQSLALVLFNEFGFKCSVWAMKEYGVVESWTNQFNVNLCNFGMKPLWVRNDDQVLVDTKDGRLASCGNGSRVNYLDVFGCTSEEYSRSTYVDSYTMSLVLLEKGSEFNDEVTFSKLPSLQLQSDDDFRKCGSHCRHIREDHQNVRCRTGFESGWN